MQITVCEFPNEASRHEAAWTELVRFLQSRPTDVVVLPEMPFCDWRMFMTKTIDPAVWEAALAAHDATIARFAALQTSLVLASRPVQIHGKRLNQAFCWTRDGGYRGAHAKYSPGAVLFGAIRGNGDSFEWTPDFCMQPTASGRG